MGALTDDQTDPDEAAVAAVDPAQMAPVYDQNRNLNLDEVPASVLLKAGLSLERHEQPSTSQQETERGPSSSPVSSFTSSGTGAGTDSSLAAGCSSADTSATQRVSQSSLAGGQADECLQSEEACRLLEPEHQNGGRIRVAFSAQHRLEPVASFGAPHPHEAEQPADSIVIRMLEAGAMHAAHKQAAELTDEEAQSLVRQLGRRMSALPHILAGRKGERKSQDRRFSMQTTFSSLPETQPDAVVGGTITTVTRSKRKTAPLPRLVAKNGTVNLFLDNIDRRQYVRDLFTTMIDIKWRYNLLAAAFGFVFSWLFFACIWYIVLYAHNDLVHENDPTWSPCIVNVYSFPAALLFSIETQSTLGFGSRIISVECPGAIVIFCVQLIFGVVVECLIVGMVFAKLSRPAKRSQTIMYSKYATVCLREGQMCLTFRVGDVRSKSHIIGATIRASLVSQKITEEGETMPFYHHQLDVKIDGSKNNLLLIWPVTIVHLIDRDSPFYQMNADQLANFKFEIITVLEGTVESTGQSIQVRSSYLPSEVKWGYRFEPIVSTHGHGRYSQTIIDYNKFNRVVAVETPGCSPMDYYSSQNRSIHASEP